jgi:alpha-1,6-mannosyltransferase
MLVQSLIRLELLLFNWYANVRLARAVEYYFAKQSNPSEGKQHTSETKIGSYYLLITASQFHIPFYSSRLLPNTFALLLVTNAYADWFKGNYHRAAMYLVFTTAIFRCDMLLLLFTVGLSMLIRRQLTILQALSIGVCTGIVSLAITVPLDSLLWGRLIWPEFEVWWFNTVDNRSSEWGSMVWHWYFTRALPKGLMATAVLIPLAFLRVPEIVDGLVRRMNRTEDERKQPSFFDFRLIPFFIPILGFVVLYSFLPHKEIRFIFPALPMFDVCAAYAMNRLHNVAFPSVISSSKKKPDTNHWLEKTMYSYGVGAITLTMVASLAFLRLSMENYPGGIALQRLRHHLVTNIPESHDSPSKWTDVRVHVDVAAAMTGVSLFGQRHASTRRVRGEGNHYVEGPYSIDKSGYEVQNMLTEKKAGAPAFTHLLTERSSVDGYHIVDTIKGNPRFDYRKLRIETKEAIFVFEEDSWRT